MKNKSVMFRLFSKLFKQYGIHIVIVLICIIGQAICTVQGTMFMQTLIDGYIVPLMKQAVPDFSDLANALTKLACFFVAGVIFSFTFSRIMVNVTQGFLRNLRDEMFEHMESLPIRYFDQTTHGDIMSVYTNDIDTLRQLISQSIPQLTSSLITIITVFVSMLTLNLTLTAISVVMVCVILFISRSVGRLSSRYFVKQQETLGKVNGYIEEMISGQKVVKVFNHEEKAIEGFRKINEELRESSYNANKFANVLMPVTIQVGNMSYIICAIVGAILALSGYDSSLTIGTLVTFMTLNRSFNNPIGQVSMQINSIAMAQAGAERIFELLDQESEIELLKMECDLRLENVDFGYNDDHMVLHDVNVFANPGEKIAFVGATGAGKTTITNLINRFYEIQKGTITYDGIDIKLIKKADLRRSLGVVLQDTHLFTGTVMDNIRYGKLDATDEECIAAAKLTSADQFIRHLPDGYNTMLTGDGANLSQGQRQLIAIARAAVANPPALILDEATSSIDTRTETLVQAGMDGLMKGRTTLVIAHRLSTIKNSDCIMVLEAGRIIERGNHESLIKEKGKYYQLYTGAIEMD